MIKILNQKEFENISKEEGINDFVAIKNNFIGYTLVSCLEPDTPEYDGRNVFTVKKAEKILSDVCSSYKMKLYELENNIKIDWNIYSSILPKINKMQPKYLISCGDFELPEFPDLANKR